MTQYGWRGMEIRVLLIVKEGRIILYYLCGSFVFAEVLRQVFDHYRH